jgi:hypothetical protein
MLTVTEFKKELANIDIFMPLPWIDWSEEEHSFCCRSCVGYELAQMFDGADKEVCYFCVQSVREGVESGDKTQIYLNYANVSDKRTMPTLALKICALLRKHGNAFEWNGDTNTSVLATLVVDKETAVLAAAEEVCDYCGDADCIGCDESDYCATCGEYWCDGDCYERCSACYELLDIDGNCEYCYGDDE